MRPEPLPVAARPLARHSEALFKARTADADRRPTDEGLPDRRSVPLTLAGQRIARELAPRLSRLLGGETPTVTGLAPRAATATDLAALAGPLAGNSLFEAAGPMPARFILSTEAQAVLRLLDRAFGGRGDLPNPLPTMLPLSSQLLIERLEGVIAEVLVAALDLADAVPIALRRDGDLAQITPFAPDESLWLFGFDIAEPAAKTWRLTLAFADAAIATLFAIADTRDKPCASVAVSGANALTGPFAEMPLPLTATLVDMAMPLSRLSHLCVGDVLPVAVARCVPLSLGGRTIARGAIGALDDRVAVQLSEAFL